MLAFLFLVSSFMSASYAAEWPDISRPIRNSITSGKRDAALIVAVEDYFVAEDVQGASQNGRDWYRWLSKSRKIPIDRIRFLENQDATKENMLTEAKRAASMVKPGGKLWFIFIGHGAPAKNQRDGLLLGVDVQQKANSIYTRGLSQKALLATLEKGEGDVIAIIDSCFSGKSYSGNSIVENLQPLIATSNLYTGGTTVLSAGKGDEFAGSLPNLSRPAFSYLALGALRGWGDKNGDGFVSAREVVQYAKKVMRVMVYDRQQTPEARGAKLDKSLTKSIEEGPNLLQMRLSSSSTNKQASRRKAPSSFTGGEDWLDKSIQKLEQQAAKDWRAIENLPFGASQAVQITNYIDKYEGQIIQKGESSRFLIVPEVKKARKWLEKFTQKNKKAMINRIQVKKFNNAIVQGKCGTAERALYGIDNPSAILTGKVDVAVCRAKQSIDDKLLWRKAWLLENKSRKSGAGRKIIQQYTGTISLSVGDTDNQLVNNARVFLDYGHHDADDEYLLGTTKNGFVQFKGVPKGPLTIVINSTNEHDPATFQFDLRNNHLTRKVKLKKQHWSKLMIPDLPSHIQLKIMKIDEWLRLNSNQQYKLRAGKYTVRAKLEGLEKQVSLYLGKGQQKLALPWGYRVVDENNRVLNEGMSFSREKLELSSPLKLQLHQNPKTRLKASIQPAAPGKIKTIKVDLSKSPDVLAGLSLQKMRRSMTKNRSGFWLSTIGVVGAGAAGGYFQIDSNSHATAARGIVGTSDTEQQAYALEVAEGSRSQNLAYVGYGLTAGTFITSALLQVQYGSLRKRNARLLGKYEKLLQQDQDVQLHVVSGSEDSLTLRVQQTKK